jgi:hypothetical protein
MPPVARPSWDKKQKSNSALPSLLRPLATSEKCQEET